MTRQIISFRQCSRITSISMLVCVSVYVGGVGGGGGLCFVCVSGHDCYDAAHDVIAAVQCVAV